MLKRRWESRELYTYDDWVSVRDGIKKMQPEVAAFDTETTGLHIINDRPFLYQFGFLDPTYDKRGFTFLIDLRTNKDALKIIKEWHYIVKDCRRYVGANVGFDLNMLINLGIPYMEPNITDLEFYIRYACDALHTEEGGPPLALKDFTARYVDQNAKYHEKLLKKARSDIAKIYNLDLKNRLSVLGAPPLPYTQKSYTLQVIQDMFKDPIFDYQDLPEDVKSVYIEWKEHLPKYLQEQVQSLVESDIIRYDTLPDAILKKYAHLDIVYTLEDFETLEPILIARKNERAIEIEDSNLYPLVDMERVGLLVDKEYLETSRVRLKEYIKERRKHLKDLINEDIKIGQHARIKTILYTRFGIDVSSTGNAELAKLNLEGEAKDFIDTIEELRSLEKWYSTYIIKFQKELIHSDRIYTQIHQVGTVSGRVSSDFQQFPKEPILDKDGNELFHPRRMILCPPNCKALMFMDYSAEELRVTAMYTVLVGNPDTNMLRAYIPFKCVQRDGKWYLEESPETEWEPVDLHAATTIAAGFSKDDPNFKHYRKTVGKRVNFAKNYGASYAKIREMFPDKTPEECHRIDESYYKAFPGLKAYHNYCFSRAQNYPYTSNMMGVKYYNVNGHKLRNLLVQGTCAHYLKIKIRKIWDYLNEIHSPNKICMEIHDELMYEIYDDNPEVLKHIKEIMEDWKDAPVPIIAEVEATSTNWAEKK